MKEEYRGKEQVLASEVQEALLMGFYTCATYCTRLAALPIEDWLDLLSLEEEWAEKDRERLAILREVFQAALETKKKILALQPRIGANLGVKKGTKKCL